MHMPLFDDEEMDKIFESMAEEIKQAQEELTAYKASPEFAKHLSDMVDYLKNNGVFVWDGYPLPVWKLPVAFDDMDQFVCALIDGIEGEEELSSIFHTLCYDCGDILVEEISGQGVIQKLHYKGI